MGKVFVIRVEFAVGQGAESEHRMGRAAVAEIDLDGVRLPSTLLAGPRRNRYRSDQ